MYHQFQNIWFNTEKHYRQGWRTSDHGKLVMRSDRLEFYGKKHKLDISNIQHISLTQLPIPWVTFFIFLSGVFVLGGVGLVLTLPERTPMGLTVAMWIGVWAFFLAIGYGIFAVYVRRNPWIVVEYLGEQKNLSRAYFADRDRERGFRYTNPTSTRTMFELLQKIHEPPSNGLPKSEGTSPQDVKSIKITDFSNQQLMLYVWQLSDGKWYYSVSGKDEGR